MRQVELKTANAYAKQRVKRDTGRFKREDWKEIAVNVYGEDVKPLHYFRVQRIMNQPEVKKLAENRIIQLLDEQGISETEGAETLKTVKELAIELKNPKILLDYVKYINELRGFSANKTVISETRHYTGSDLVNNYKEAKKTIKISKEVDNINLESEEKTRDNTNNDAKTD